MKKIISVALIILVLTGCRGCFTSFPERKSSILKICPTCTFVMSEGQYYAVDTAKRPNIIYIINFKAGGAYYTASDVDYLRRVN